MIEYICNKCNGLGTLFDPNCTAPSFPCQLCGGTGYTTFTTFPCASCIEKDKHIAELEAEVERLTARVKEFWTGMGRLQKQFLEVIAERDAAFALSKCECGAEEACRNLVEKDQRIAELEAKLAAVGNAIKTKLGDEWATESGDPPLAVQMVLDDIAALLQEEEK